MNPSLKALLVLIIAVEVSLAFSQVTNLLIMVVCLGLILIKTNLKTALKLIVIPFLAAFSAFASVYWFNQAHDFAIAANLFTRIYVYTLTTAVLTVTTTKEAFARSLEQNLHLPSKFAYSTLAALNLVSRVKQDLVQIKTAAMMRGIYLSFWSPVLYFKAITTAFAYSDSLAQGMQSHGFVEGQKRSTLVIIPLTVTDCVKFVAILVVFNLCLFLLP